jgi:tryptophan-rich sensory protein
LIGVVDQDWTENSRIPIFFLSLWRQQLSFLFLFSDFSLLFAAAKGRVIKPYSPKWASPYGLVFGHVWAILYLGGKPNPTNLPLPD